MADDQIITGFITGTGFYSLPGMSDVENRTVETPYGAVPLEVGTWGAQRVAFVPRHGKQHTVLPGDINYRANVYALYQLGAERILATSVCGSLVKDWGPGSLVLVENFIHFTSGRATTFYPREGKLAHVDVTDPYCATLPRYLLSAASELGITLHQGATYACFDGPRFETRAEIEMVRRLGGHLAGMTNYPECVLARELAICYETVGVVSNYAAGMSGKLTVEEVNVALARMGDAVTRLFVRTLEELPPHYDCACRHALDGAWV
jgi:5'-methylthioadenosine phosphorylase